VPDVSGLTGSPGGNVAAALLAMQAVTMTLDTASALNSSPWTSENFGADPEKAASCREYVWHSVAVSMGMCAIASWISRSWVPLLAGGAASAYLWWIYERALARGATAGSGGWAHG